MGFLSRLLIPHPVRRAAHPVRSAKHAITPRPVRQLRRAAHPVDNAGYAVERSLRRRRG